MKSFITEVRLSSSLVADADGPERHVTRRGAPRRERPHPGLHPPARRDRALKTAQTISVRLRNGIKHSPRVWTKVACQNVH